MTEELSGKRFSDVYGYFLAGEDTITLGDSLNFDANKNIQEAFEKKFTRKNHDDYVVAKDFYDKHISKIDFNTFTPMTIDQYASGVQAQIDSINQFLDWAKLKAKLFGTNIQK